MRSGAIICSVKAVNAHTWLLLLLLSLPEMAAVAAAVISSRFAFVFEMLITRSLLASHGQDIRYDMQQEYGQVVKALVVLSKRVRVL